MSKGKIFFCIITSFFLFSFPNIVHAEEISNLELCVVSDDEKETNFLYRIFNDNYESWLEVKNNECSQIKLLLGDYSIMLLPKANYELDEIVGLNDLNFSIDDSGSKSITIKYNSVKNNFIIRNGSKKNKLYGEEIIEHLQFQPSISVDILNETTNFKKGDIVHFAITVTNNENFTINNVLVEENMDSVTILENENYTIQNNKSILIRSIRPLSSIKIYVDYEVKDEDNGILNNEVVLVSAEAENGSQLREGNIKDEKSFNIVMSSAVIKLCKNTDNLNYDEVFIFNIKNSSSYETWIELKNNECKEINVDYGIYNISEIGKAGYNLLFVEGLDENGNININEQKEYEILFKNKYNVDGFLYGFGYIKNDLNGA